MLYTANIKPYKLTAIITAWDAVKAAKRDADFYASLRSRSDAQKAADKVAADAARVALEAVCLCEPL